MMPSTFTQDVMSRLGDDDPVSVIVKLRGETCNIDCLYCYEKRKEEPGGARIEVEHIEKLRSLFPTRPLAIELHGGEPLTIGKPAMITILQELRTLVNVTRVSLQTNGLLLDDEWLDLFELEYPELEIGLSLDGDEKGNSWRVDYKGDPTYAGVVQALDLLNRRNCKVGVICAVTPEIVHRPIEVMTNLASFPAVATISFVPCFDQNVRTGTKVKSERVPESRLIQVRSITSKGPSWAISPQEYSSFVLTCSEWWIKTGAFRRITLEPTVDVIRRLRGLRARSCHFAEKKCFHVNTLYADSRFGSCDELPWPQVQYGRLGHLPGPLSRSQEANSTLSQGLNLMQKCMTCNYHDTCGGGCVAVRLRLDTSGSDDDYCDSRAQLVDGVASLVFTGKVHQNLRWISKSPNEMADADEFLASWGRLSGKKPAQIRRSEYGNLNHEGLPGNQAADDLAPSHPDWQRGIEARVWGIVDYLTATAHLVTYDSCEGHDYGGEPTLTPRLFQVGILPRTGDELNWIVDLALATLSSYQNESAQLIVGMSYLSSGSTLFPCIEVQLAPRHDFESYFAGLDESAAALLFALKSGHHRLGAIQ